MRVAYFNCFAGISGDMIVGSLLDLGLAIDKLKTELEKITIGDYEIKAHRVTKQHISATKFDVDVGEQKVIRTWNNIRGLIEQSNLSTGVKDDAIAIFKRIAQAEAKIHGKTIDQVHFHEVGAVDSIVDVVSSVIGIAELGIQKIYSSSVATGIGMAKTEHGLLPLPAPATLEILAGAPIYSSGVTAELATPTGAAILMQYATFTEEIPKMKLLRTGYGAGARELEIPNVLSVLIGEQAEEVYEEVTLIETNIDDISAEILGYTMESLLELGALDVWFTPIEMKKNRPAILLSVLVSSSYSEQFIDKIFTETSTLGVRVSRQSRVVAEREIIQADTPLGRIRVKVGKYKGKIISVAPEYDDCRKIAAQADIAIREVYDLARQTAVDMIQKG